MAEKPGMQVHDRERLHVHASRRVRTVQQGFLAEPVGCRCQ